MQLKTRWNANKNVLAILEKEKCFISVIETLMEDKEEEKKKEKK